MDVEQEVAHLVTLEGVDQVTALDDLPAGVEMQVSPTLPWGGGRHRTCCPAG